MKLAEIHSLEQLADAIVDQAEFYDAKSLLSAEQQKKKLRDEVFEALEMNEVTGRLASAIDFLLHEGMTPLSKADQVLVKKDISRMSSGATHWEETTADLQHALGISDRSMQVWVHIANELYQHKRFDQAGDIFTLLAVLSPNFEGYCLGLGGCEQMAGNINEAIKAYANAIEITQTDALPYLLSCECYLLVNDMVTAKDLLQKGTEVMKTHGSKPICDKLAASLQSKLSEKRR